MNAEDIRNLVNNDPDFIASRRFGCSLKKLEARYPDGDCPDRVIADALATTEEDIKVRHERIVQFARADMGVGEES